MYFEAEVKNKKYKILVSENENSWSFSVEEVGAQTAEYEIPKKDILYLDSAISIIFKNASFLVDVVGSGTDYTAYARSSFRTIKIYNEESLLHESLKAGGQISHDLKIIAGMPGKISKVYVKPGDLVKAHTPLVVMEAMKMENEIRATKDATIKNVLVKQGDHVETGAVLIEFQ